ncbi:ABC transporter substrate-binding protein [Aquiflexum gelatinilyticum]|uniref:Helical backbone metal receptor n=1 Tax=Aquiflexum gelatinilyticum TaxID=2961943 RepID=A0A9X2P6K7_9BACT|nr:helical backbone metal receptor [Aquiflexum gelatinilyticum]MCR9017289.1 helical backbone metal receptor [Aquiflexum gelatinilyticum]
MPYHKDQLNRTISLPNPPKRIVSLVPSQTEFLVDLGLRDKIVGVTKFCIHPKGLKKEITVIGGTKNFHFDKIESLQPDLIIGNKEENYQEGIEKLAEKFPVWMSDIYTLEDAYRMILSIGELTDTFSKANEIVSEIKHGLEKEFKLKGSAIYLIWKDPLIAVGSNTFIDFMLEKAGFKNLINPSRYPEIDLEEIVNLNPQFLLLSSEPFPFEEKHILFFQEKLPKTKIKIVDGEMFSWYGSRLLFAGRYFESI